MYFSVFVCLVLVTYPTYTHTHTYKSPSNQQRSFSAVLAPHYGRQKVSHNLYMHVLYMYICMTYMCCEYVRPKNRKNFPRTDRGHFLGSILWLSKIFRSDSYEYVVDVCIYVRKKKRTKITCELTEFVSLAPYYGRQDI